MIFRMLTAIACAVGIAGCTTSSGPAHNTDVVTLANGAQAYRVQCLGLLESSQACMNEIRRVCGDQTAVRIALLDRSTSGMKPENDPREILFQCVAPVAQQPVQSPPAPAVAPVATPAPVRKVTLQGDANFALDSAALTPAATAKLGDFVAANRDVQIDSLKISGYTDSTGSATLNERLSAARARSVQRYLAGAGVRAAKWDVQGFGSVSPIAPNTTAIGRAKNRRVEIQADGQ
ncbi:OmpA family protein [Burkholderia sp. Ac-20365]|uniref:OmpA family protein n=1 Tax=Burkholderia sp. Ac-20365 TaxID=2703897 RepID=UPI00197B4363|nr:OmpA family protein [Burkholderia sp. Ac-20365]MBN3765189.1 OmpA family protein [Burkholderia sp. Ac-20365]